MSARKWEPPGTTPCCGQLALQPLLYPCARLWLLLRASFILGAVNGCCWMQRDYPPLQPR